MEHIVAVTIIRITIQSLVVLMKFTLIMIMFPFLGETTRSDTIQIIRFSWGMGIRGMITIPPLMPTHILDIWVLIIRLLIPILAPADHINI